jgi:hypothetical protein
MATFHCPSLRSTPVKWIPQPILIAQAASPSLGALLIGQFGAGTTIAVLAGAAVVNILLVLPLVPLALHRPIAA